MGDLSTRQSNSKAKGVISLCALLIDMEVTNGKQLESQRDDHLTMKSSERG